MPENVDNGLKRYPCLWRFGCRSVAFPPPIPKGQPLSVSLFHCGMARVRGGSCGFLRTSPRAHRTFSAANFALSGHSSLLPRSPRKGEVRKRPNFCHCNSDSYARTIQAVGCDHCLPEGNYQPGGESWAEPVSLLIGEGGCGKARRNVSLSGFEEGARAVQVDGNFR